MGFKENIAGSFSRIKEDMKKLRYDIDINSKTINHIVVKIDDNTKAVAKISEKLEELAKAIEISLLHMEKQGKSTIENDLNCGKSSIRNRGTFLSSKTIKSINSNPLVSNGTIPKKENRRSIKIKKKIFDSIEARPLVSSLYSFIVDDMELCSKTSFYRFINEMERGEIISLQLIKGKRFAKKLIKQYP